MIVLIRCVDYSAIGVDEIVLWYLFLGYLGRLANGGHC